MNLSLSPELQHFIQRKIDSGMYSNASEVVRDALRRMDEYDHWRDLRAFMTPRIDAMRQGDVVSTDMESILRDAKNKKRR